MLEKLSMVLQHQQFSSWRAQYNRQRRFGGSGQASTKQNEWLQNLLIVNFKCVAAI